MPQFVYSSVIEAPVERVFAFHESPDALERLLPPGGRVRVVSREGGLEKGARVVLEMCLGPLRKRWVARHTEYVPDTLFADVQESGPFRSWAHRHEFAAEGRNACRLTDRVEFSLPGGRLVDWLAGWAAKLALRAMFRARHAATRRAVT
jgi:ligand-binding SRPBCC domain-containing protein